MPGAKAVAESIFREQAGRITAALVRISGSFDLAEEALQDAFAAALARWPETGIPDNPAAWPNSAFQQTDYPSAARTEPKTTQRRRVG
jgi:predicted RNA polymerase sigma factor